MSPFGPSAMSKSKNAGKRATKMRKFTIYFGLLKVDCFGTPGTIIFSVKPMMSKVGTIFNAKTPTQ